MTQTHPLDGCRAKLLRAHETIQALTHEVSALECRNPPPFRVVRENRDTEFVFLAYGESTVPLRLPVLAGEVIHHLRSSLDHVIHALVIKKGHTPTKQHQFPICTTEKAFKDACYRGMIEGVGPSAKKLIIQVQPYTSNTPEDTILHVVSQYDNTDKHRLLVVMQAAAEIGNTLKIGTDSNVAIPSERQGRAPAIVGMSPPFPRAVSPDGAVIFSVQFSEPAPEVIVDAALVPVIAFEQCGRVKSAPFMKTLTGLFHGVRNTVESFAGEF